MPWHKDDWPDKGLCIRDYIESAVEALIKNSLAFVDLFPNGIIINILTTFLGKFIFSSNRLFCF